VHANVSSQSAVELHIITDVHPVPDTQCCPLGHIESIEVWVQMPVTSQLSMVHAV
jgi:hypothetical protein